MPKTVTRQRRDCDLNPGPSAPESSTLTTRLPSHHHECPSRNNVPPPCIAPKIVRTSLRRWAYSRCVSCEDRFTNVRPEIAYLLCRKPAEMRNQRGRRRTMRLSRKSRTEVAAAASELCWRECGGGVRLKYWGPGRPLPFIHSTHFPLIFLSLTLFHPPCSHALPLKVAPF